RNLAMDTLDLVQLHCPPPAIYRDDRTFDVLDALAAEGKIAAWGVSVETCEEALISLEREHLASIQIILNPFRLKPLEEVVPLAREKGVAIIARVPLASGLLTGKFSPSSSFAANDHRSFNRHGEAFDQGETFSGVDYETGLTAVARLEEALDGAMPLAEASLRWILAQPGVTAAIPGASSGEQARRNAAAGSAPTPKQAEILTRFDAAVRETYDELLRESIHPRW
ncbi:MAG TPA: aldo/keto reductase, partial [Brachybacterium massiliense]|nr:aldo/keto reductase [Brachybacterium massiliense]